MSERMLRVDDNEKILKSLELILTGAGYQVRCALSGNIALVVVEKQRIDRVCIGHTDARQGRFPVVGRD